MSKPVPVANATCSAETAMGPTSGLCVPPVSRRMGVLIAEFVQLSAIGRAVDKAALHLFFMIVCKDGFLVHGILGLRASPHLPGRRMDDHDLMDQSQFCPGWVSKRLIW